MQSFEEPLRIISDLHLAHPDCIIEDPRHLAPLFRGVRTVIFNGDTVELRFLKGRLKGRKLAEAVKETCLGEGAQPVFINGNHDPILSATSHLDLVGGAVLLTHGDLLFHDISPWSKEAIVIGEAHTRALSELADDAFHDFEMRLKAGKRAALALELHKPPRYRGPLAALATILRECWPPWRPLQIIRCWVETPDKAVDLARVFRPQARFIIIGHTHLAGVWRRGPRVIINTGSFLSVGGRQVVDLHDRELVVRKVERRKGQFELGSEAGRFTATKLKPHEGY